MRCESCQRENPDDAAFCSQCGSRLGLACPGCGRPYTEDSRFCGGCGRRLAGDHHDALPTPADVTPPHLAAKILRERGHIEGERRTVTVLFIDAVGSVSTGEKLPHEELHRIVRTCTERMVAAVHRYEGTVAQFRGDGIMALFGAPIAHEDAARRAISAALAMREALQVYERELKTAGSRAFTYRIGINTGPVIVGRIGDDLSMDYTAIGDTVNLAARMEQWAAPGRIYVTEATRRLAETYFEYEDLGMLEVKGKAELIHVFDVLRELPSRTRLEAAVSRGLTPYVGRAHELSVLRSHLEQAKAGRGQVVFVSGEAGIGKSRMLLEFQRSLEGEDVTWLSGQCISYGSNIAYLPIADLLKRSIGVEEGDDDATIIRRVDERAQSWDEPTRAAVPYVKFLLNVDPGDEGVARMDPMERRAGILDALRALLIRGSSQRPVVMAIEDLHWVDEKSEEAIAALVEITAASRVLMVLTYRPGYAHSLGDRAYYSRIALQSLPAEESGALLESVLQTGACPDEVRRLVTAKAEGNPFFIEEVTKSLVESGTLRRTNGTLTLAKSLSDVFIPETVQEVILTRIDRLETDARDAIQLASVIGREFTARLLDRISQAQSRLEGVLAELKSLELIYEKDYFPELSYMFKHALTHDVAYSTLLEERRRSLHRIVAMAVEELYADRLAEQYETLAYHYERGEQWDKATEYLTKSGEKAVAAYANANALDYFARALHAAQQPGHDLGTARFSEIAILRASVAMTIGDMPAALADAALAATHAHERGDAVSETRALTWVGVAQMWMHDFEASKSTLAQARELADGCGDDDARFSAYAFSFELEAILTGSVAADPYLNQATALRDKATDAFALGAYLTDAVFIKHHWRGAFRQAADEFASHASTIRTMPLSQWTVGHRWAEGLALAHVGEYESALSLLREVLDLAGRVGEVMFPPRALNSIGWIYGELESHEEAIRWNQRSAEAGRALEMPDPEIECNARLNWADSLVALGRGDEANEHLEFVGRVVEHPAPEERWMLWRYAQHYFHSRGESHLARGDAETALMLAERCRRAAEESEARKNIVKGCRLSGQARMALGDLAAAETEIGFALELALEIGNPGQLWKTYEAMGDLRLRQGRVDQARASFRAALGVMEGMAASLSDPDLRTGLETSAAMQRLRERAGGD